MGSNERCLGTSIAGRADVRGANIIEVARAGGDLIDNVLHLVGERVRFLAGLRAAVILLLLLLLLLAFLGGLETHSMLQRLGVTTPLAHGGVDFSRLRTAGLKIAATYAGNLFGGNLRASFRVSESITARYAKYAQRPVIVDTMARNDCFTPPLARELGNKLAVGLISLSRPMATRAIIRKRSGRKGDASAKREKTGCGPRDGAKGLDRERGKGGTRRA
ncbi:hypothetical protein ALC60_01125 [Trachymyrmex zeteki]|uniref:Uncharacterized protein n=1 Tax=Mycetomoellerius zeteki TaxID=64791 RepID=A0A151XHQ2_9HYME|nr:hypothetical protein ALC60_01125 [Trachymyrmex zeteki]